MRKQATLFQMVNKMKTSPLAIALELSKTEMHGSQLSTTSQSSLNEHLTEEIQVTTHTQSHTLQLPAPSTIHKKRSFDAYLSESSFQEKSAETSRSFQQASKMISEDEEFDVNSYEVIEKKQKVETQPVVFQEKAPKVVIHRQMEVEKTIAQKIDLSNLRSLSDISFNPYKDAPFAQGEDIPFSFLVDCLEEISKTKGENSKEKIIDIICNVYRTILYFKPDQLIFAFYFCIMKIYPDYQKNKELGVGSQTLFKAISKATGREERKLRDDMNTIGDIGKVAALSKATQSNLKNFFTSNSTKTKQLTIKGVIETFRQIAGLRGNNSNIERERIMTKLIQEAKEDEAKFIIRFIEANFHIGAAALTMINGLIKTFLIVHNVNEKTMSSRTKGWKYYIPNYDAQWKKYDEIVTRAINEFPDFDRLVEGLVQCNGKIEDVSKYCKITVGTPVNPMLAQPVAASESIMKRLQHTKFTCEYKYDGLRGQIHYKNGEILLFSRNQIDMTEAYPDVVDVLYDVVERNKEVKEFIIDSEIVAYNPQTQKILPFQKLSTRGRKNVDQSQIEIQVCVFAFDLLYFNGESQLDKILRERRRILKENFLPVDNRFGYVKQKDLETEEEVKEFLEESIKEGAEGLMVKGLDQGSIYEPGIRSWHWLKLKKDYLEDGSADTYDLVPIGAYYGTGKRAGIFGGFLLACYNSDRERYETFCVCGRGFTDEEMEKYHKYFLENSLPQCPSNYFVGTIGAHLWLKPTVVWETKGSDIQLSPVYTAGIGEVDTNRGFGLRFPRVVKIRDDKDVTDATDSTMIAEIYRNQAAVLNDEF